MAKKSSTVNLDQEFGGVSAREWDTMWKPTQGGFVHLNPELVRVHGLFRLSESGTAKFVGSGVQLRGRGIYDRLKQLVANQTSSNDHPAAAAIRARKDNLKIEILDLGKPGTAQAFAISLKNILVRYHQYEFNKLKGPEDIARVMASTHSA